MSDREIDLGEKAMGQVTSEFDTYKILTNELVEAVDNLETRLVKVTREPEQPKNAETSEGIQKVLMAIAIDETNGRLLGALNRIKSLLERLEI